MYRDLQENPNKNSLAKNVRNVPQSLAFNEVWLNEEVGDKLIFMED